MRLSQRGEIQSLDSADYGYVTINQAVTLLGAAWPQIGKQRREHLITIAAAKIGVHLSRDAQIKSKCVSAGHPTLYNWGRASTQQLPVRERSNSPLASKLRNCLEEISG